MIASGGMPGMPKNEKRRKNVLPDDGILRYVRFAILPLVVILLIVVIIKADSRPGEETKGTTSAAMTESQTPESTDQVTEGIDQTPETGAQEPEGTDQAPETGDQTPEGTDQTPETETPETEPQSLAANETAPQDISQYPLKQDEVPELLKLVQTYCQAKEDCDPQLLAGVFGTGPLTEEEAETEKAKMELVKASIKSYENISCYSIEGPEADSYVMFPYFEIRYREAEQFMPVLTWAYGTKGEDGQYHMTQDVSEETAEYISRIGGRDDVKALIAQVKAAGQEAVAADAKLQSIYGAAGGSEVSIGQTTQP